jgi:Glycosyl transferase family 2
VSLYFVMMQRDDPSLRRWLDHYTAITPPDHLIVLDNGSTEPATLGLLRQAEADGVRVIRDFDAHEHFRRKGEIIASVIDSLPSDDGTFAVPVDCDELLVVFTDHGLSTSAADIREEFDRLRPFDCSFRIEYSLFNVPERAWLFRPQHYQKSFTKAGQLASLDHGYHWARSISGPKHELTRFAYLHYHNPSWRDWWRLARLKLLHTWDIDIPEQRTAFLSASPLAGGHLLEQVRGGEAAYLGKYDDELCIGWNHTAPGLVTLNEPGRPPALWNGAAYLRANPDVAAHYELGALYHYLSHGRRECRRLRSLPVGAAR